MRGSIRSAMSPGRADPLPRPRRRLSTCETLAAETANARRGFKTRASGRGSAKQTGLPEETDDALAADHADNRVIADNRHVVEVFRLHFNQ